MLSHHVQQSLLVLLRIGIGITGFDISSVKSEVPSKSRITRRVNKSKLEREEEKFKNAQG